MTNDPHGASMPEPPYAATPPAYPSAPPASAYPTPGGYPAAPPAYGQAYAPVDPNTSTNTIWIWLAIIVPFLGLLPLFFYDWDAAFAQAQQQLESAGGSLAPGMNVTVDLPGQTLLTGVGFLTSAVSVLFFALDYRELGRRGIQKRFHWAWSLLGAVTVGALLPVIGRTVVLRKQGLRAFAPLWTLIICIVVSVTAIIATVLPAALEFIRGSIGA